MTGPAEPRTALVGEVPITYLHPDTGAGRPPIALWFPHLTGTKEDCIPVLRRLAGAGFLAISIETGEELGARVFGGFREHMWPILGRTTFDARAVVDWAVEESAAPDVVAGRGLDGRRHRGCACRHRRHRRRAERRVARPGDRVALRSNCCS